MRRGGFHLFAYVVGGVLLLASSPSFAQRITGDITGTVADATGAVVPGATLTAENVATRLTRTATTSGAGGYRLPELPVGIYKVSVSAQGFKTMVREVQVAIAQVTTADFTLQVGERTETIVVEAATPIIELAGNLNNYVDAARINEVPLNGRDFNSLLGITPGVQRAPGGGFLAVNISGARRTANNYLLDGMYNNDRYYGDSSLNQTGVVGIPATLVPMDAIAEFTVQQIPSAEFGVKGGAPINVVLKSGGNDWHGSAHYYRHTDFADARNFFADDKTALRNQQYGATLGGPFIKDKTFFFFYWEAQRYTSLADFEEDAVTSAMVAEARGRINCTSPNSMPGCVPQATSPAGEALFSFYPVVTSASLTPVPTAVSVPGIAEGDSFAFKVDHRISANHLLTGRYVIGDSTQSSLAFAGTWAPPPTNVSGLGPSAFNSFAPSRAQQVGISYTWNISPTLLAETRFGYQRFSQILGPNNQVDPLDLGIDTGPLDPLDFGVPAVYYFGPAYMGYIGGVGGYPIVTAPNDSFDISEHVTWTKGKHAIKFGGNWQHARTFSIRNRARSVLGFFGYYGYGASGNGDVDAIVQMLLGRADLAQRAFGSTVRNLFQDSVGVYVTDDWKVHPRLTLTFGLRYDISGALGEESDLGSNFDPARGLVDLGSGIDALYDIDRNNFGPRVGFAWDIFGNGKTALRGGYALTYDIPNFGSIHAPRTGFFPLGTRSGAYTQINQGIFSVTVGGGLIPASGSGFPEDPNATCANATGVGDYICLNQPLYGPNPTGTPPFDVFSVVRDLKTPLYHYFNVTFQHEVFKNNVFTMSYVGSRGRDLLMYRNLNAPLIGCNVPPSPGCVRPFAAQFPDFEDIIQLTNDADSQYDSLQVSFTQRNWHGIDNQYNFTWGHCIDNNSINRGSRFAFSQFQNPYNPDANKGNCSHDVTRNFNFGGTYDLPKASALGRVGEGWQIGSVLTLLSGRPFTPGIGSRDRSGQGMGVIHASTDGTPVQINERNPDQYVVESLLTPSSPLTAVDPCGRSPHEFLDPPTNSIPNPAFTSTRIPISPFFEPCTGTVGNAGRNSLRGPGLAQLDMSIVKNTKITERVSLQFRWEVFNVFNRANFGTPFSNVRLSDFGTITTTPDVEVVNPVIAQGGARNMQFALKLKF